MTTVRGFSAQVKVTPTTSGAYSNGDQVGVTGSNTYIVIPGAASVPSGITYLKSIKVVNEGAAQTAQLEFNFYNSSLVVGVADNSAWAVSPSDEALYWQGKVTSVTGDWTAHASHEVGEIDGSMDMMKTDKSGKLYCIIRVASGTPTFANGNLNLVFNFVQD